MTIMEFVFMLMVSLVRRAHSGSSQEGQWDAVSLRGFANILRPSLSDGIISYSPASNNTTQSSKLEPASEFRTSAGVLDTPSYIIKKQKQNKKEREKRNPSSGSRGDGH